MSTLAELTTLGVGGEIGRLVEVDTEADFIDALREADAGGAGEAASGAPLLVLGGGSNLVGPDGDFPGTVVRDRRAEITVTSDTNCGGVSVRVSAGQPWDEFVAYAVEAEWVGVEALSGIPGTCGAAPVQNIGAYGQEVAQTLASVRVWDRAEQRPRMFAVGELGLGYRKSILKVRPPRAGRLDGTPLEVLGGAVDAPTGRWVVLSAEFQFKPGDYSAPVAYAQLAEKLGVEIGQRAPSRDVRAAVLELRRGKGMVLDAGDPDSRSAGSFFTNPIIPEAAAAGLPEGCPRWPAGDGLVKVSAAWLIDHAGVSKGYALPGSGAAVSSKHVLALTNRGGASAADVHALAADVVRHVHAAYGVGLSPEPIIL